MNRERQRETERDREREGGEGETHARTHTRTHAPYTHTARLKSKHVITHVIHLAVKGPAIEND